MGLEFILSIVGLITSLLAGATLINDIKLLRQLTKFLQSEKNAEKQTYSEKLKELTSNIEKSSQEMDSLLVELSEVAKERESNIREIESDLVNLQSREKELKTKIENLEKVPLPVAEYFAELTSEGEKRSARRDYYLFGAGAIVSTIITIVLKLVFGI